MPAFAGMTEWNVDTFLYAAVISPVVAYLSLPPPPRVALSPWS